MNLFVNHEVGGEVEGVSRGGSPQPLRSWEVQRVSRAMKWRKRTAAGGLLSHCYRWCSQGVPSRTFNNQHPVSSNLEVPNMVSFHCLSMAKWI